MVERYSHLSASHKAAAVERLAALPVSHQDSQQASRVVTLTARHAERSGVAVR